LLGLNAPSDTKFDLKNTPEDPKMTSHTDPGASSSMDYDLNKTFKEIEDILGRTGR